MHRKYEGHEMHESGLPMGDAYDEMIEQQEELAVKMCRFCGSTDVHRNVNNPEVSVVEFDGHYCGWCGRWQ